MFKFHKRRFGSVRCRLHGDVVALLFACSFMSLSCLDLMLSFTSVVFGSVSCNCRFLIMLDRFYSLQRCCHSVMLPLFLWFLCPCARFAWLCARSRKETVLSNWRVICFFWAGPWICGDQKTVYNHFIAPPSPASEMLGESPQDWWRNQVWYGRPMNHHVGEMVGNVISGSYMNIVNSWNISANGCKWGDAGVW